MNTQIEIDKKAIDELDRLKAAILKGDIEISTVDNSFSVGFRFDNSYGHTGEQTTTFNYFNKALLK